ncbi:P-loop containing nucleoside triphosphate hydrolase protein [Lactarius psammicola]|nr:P-loop containing nucleoside triphosphate hydrolase protein [Lactarius psammicola]
MPAKKKAKKAQATEAVEAETEAVQPPTQTPAELPAEPPAEPPTAAPVKDEDEGADGETGAGEGDAKKKKKKKKAKKDDEPPPPPAKKKGGAGISALKAMMEEKKRLEEEARRKEEEERKRIEEEERKAEEEERRKEEEKQRKKEREKAKRELAKKEGRLLTKKQKEDQRAAEIRRQALLASGVQIEGLQQAGAPPKRPVYGNRKRGGPAKGASPAPDSVPQTPEPSRPNELASEPTPELESGQSPPGSATDDVQDDWEASSEEETPLPAEMKESWDDSSDEEEAEAAPVTVTTPAQKPTPAPQAVKKPVPTKANGSTTKPQPKKAEPTNEKSESEDDSDEDSSESDSEEAQTIAQKMAAQRKAEAAARRQKAREDALAAGSKDDLRSPICCILGHVDTGKTKLLDKIRQTNVQEGEAGGITQQIGATYFPVEAIKMKTAVLNKDDQQDFKIPGLLIIDTPGHESFTNLRSRGSSLCNIAILVVDIMHGLEPQTLESLRLLRDRKTPFIVALNKIDRIYGWDATPDGAFRESLAKQKRTVQREFEDRVQKTILAFAEQGLNSVLYYENKNFARNVSLVPTSAITGEGVPDMIMLLVNLTQQRMSDRLMYLSELECTVLEVKVIEGLGTTIDVVLSNGILREGDKIVVCGLNGPIVTQVRALLTPQPLRELRIKSSYVHHKEVKAALGVKIVAPELEKAIAGSRLLVIGPDDDEDVIREEVMSELTSLFDSVDKSGRGVCVQASTLGSLEALLDFLRVSKIPVSGINIGPVHKKDVMRASTMLEKARELACILCFDVPIDKDADRLAEEMGIRLFKADIIYHLFDAFTEYNAEIVEARRRDAAPMAVWPCRLKTIACFCKRDPIILGVDILDGTLRLGTPLCVVKNDPATGAKEIIELGKITSLEINHKSMELVKKSQAGGGVAVKIEHAVYQSAKLFGRHFDDKDEVYSRISRQSIDTLKDSFKADVSNEEWLLIKALKQRLDIP